MKKLNVAEMAAKNNTITVKEGKLFFGNKEVNTEGGYFNGEIMVNHYCVRQEDGSFVGGLDIVDNGYFSLGGFRTSRNERVPRTYHRDFAGIALLLDVHNPDTIGNNWYICEEDGPTDDEKHLDDDQDDDRWDDYQSYDDRGDYITED